MCNTRHCIHRYRAAFQERFHQSTLSLSGILCSRFNQTTTGSAATARMQEFAKERMQRARLCLFDNVPVKNMTLRQLRDSVQNLQMQWVPMQIAETMQPEAMEAVDALFHRFGVLASQVRLSLDWLALYILGRQI